LQAEIKAFVHWINDAVVQDDFELDARILFVKLTESGSQV